MSGIDSSATYFFFQSRPGTTEVRKVSDPLRTAIFSNEEGEWIFLKNDHIYLFGRAIDNINPNVRDFILGETYFNDGHQWNLKKRIVIDRNRNSPTPFTVEDLDPWSSSLLLRDSRDIGNDQWLLYNMDTGNMKDLGNASYWGFFLKEDLIIQSGPYKTRWNNAVLAKYQPVS